MYHKVNFASLNSCVVFSYVCTRATIKQRMMRSTSVKIWMIPMKHANGIVKDCIDYLTQRTILQGSGPKQRIYPCTSKHHD